MAPKPIGILIVVVLKARNLHDKHQLYKQDVFAEAKLNDTAKRTQVDAKGGQHPVWDEELRFPIFGSSVDKHRSLEVACYAKEPKSEDLLGKGTLDISDTLKTGEFDGATDWVPLKINDVERGEIYLEMTYYASAPSSGLRPDLQRRPSKLPQLERLSRAPQATRPVSRSPKDLDPLRSSPSRLPTAASGDRNWASQKSAVTPSHPAPSLPLSLRPGGPGKSPPASSLPRAPIASSSSTQTVYGPALPPSLRAGGLTPRPNAQQYDFPVGSHSQYPQYSSPLAQIPAPISGRAPALPPGPSLLPVKVGSTHLFAPRIPHGPSTSSDYESRLLARYSSPLPLPINSVIPINPAPHHIPHPPESGAERNRAREKKDREMALELDKSLNI